MTFLVAMAIESSPCSLPAVPYSSQVPTPPTAGQDQRVTDPKEQRKAQIQNHFLIHASQCRVPACMQTSCIQMKRVLRHTRDCKLRMSGNCGICKQFLHICYSHARTCTEDMCPVPVCARMKQTFREQQMQRRRQNDGKCGR